MNEKKKHISNLLKAGNFYCQELIVLDDNTDELLSELTGMKIRFPQSFSNLNIVINFCELSIDESILIEFLTRLKNEIEKIGHKVVGIIGVKTDIALACNIKPVKQRIEETSNSLISGKSKEPVNEQQKKQPVETIKEIGTKIIKEHIRSGQSIYAEKQNLIIIGDVKCGAEIAADYSVTVLGKLQGRAHAGVAGCASSTVTSVNFDPELVSVKGIFLANQDIEPALFGKSVLIQLNKEEDKIVVHTM